MGFLIERLRLIVSFVFWMATTTPIWSVPFYSFGWRRRNKEKKNCCFGTHTKEKKMFQVLMKRYGTQARRAAKGARPRAHARGWHNATKGERERENTRRRRRRTNSQVSLSDSLFLTSRRRSGESARSALSHRLEGRHLHQGPSVEWTPRPATRRLYSHRPFALFSTSVRHQCAPCCFFFYLVRKFQIHRHWIITGLFWIFSLFFGEKRRFLMDWEPLRKALRMLISRVLLTRLLFFCVYWAIGPS